MVSYKAATLIQAILIIVVGYSIVDFGYALQLVTEDKHLYLNDALFSDDGSEFWNGYAFWAYCFFVVAILQILKDEK
ncbi:MAG: hypothetical protein ACW98K_08090 [Candidatus Kariarchaeaceae archaeon]|jgi:hypothetical protein